MRYFLAAIRFLTIVPLPGKCGADAADLAGSVWFFPTVGLVIGGFSALVAAGLWAVFPPLVAAAGITIVLAAASGALHIDGLADTADGFLSSRPRERILEIMKDSSTGAMGVTAIVSALILKVAALGCFTPDTAWRAVLLMPLAGRCAMVVMISALPYARPEGGLGAAFAPARSPWPAAWAVAALACAGWVIAGTAGLIACGAALAATVLFALWSLRKIGGATGDTFGAACELAEIAVALALAAAPVAALIPRGAA